MERSIENRLLRRLPPADLTRIRQRLESVPLERRTQLSQPGVAISHVYFPESAVLSAVHDLEDGSSVEVATTGREGFVGLPVFLGAASSPTRTFCQVPGDVLRMTSVDFRDELTRPSPLQPLLGLYAQALIVQVSQTAACNRAHALQERCARWLLMTHDRVGKDVFELAQQFLAMMLGVDSDRALESISELRALGVLEYVRGVVTILDRSQLENICCACYRVVRAEYERLLGSNGRSAF